MAQWTVRERARQQSRKLTDHISIHTEDVETENQKHSQALLETLKTQDPRNTSSRQAPLLKVPYITHKHHHQLRTKGSNAFKPPYGQGEDYLIHTVYKKHILDWGHGLVSRRSLVAQVKILGSSPQNLHKHCSPYLYSHFFKRGSKGRKIPRSL